MTDRISGTSGQWQTLSVRFKPGDDLAKATGYGETVTRPISRALMEAFALESVDIDTVTLIADRAWKTRPEESE